MKKLRLNPEELTVASFHTCPPERDGGTVQGYAFAWSDGSICPTATTTRTTPP